MIRGDTKKFKWKIEAKTTTGEKTWWIPSAVDKVYFTCKKDENSPIAFQKIYPKDIEFNEKTGYFSTTIEPHETSNLSFGKYMYDIEVVTNAMSNNKNDKRVVKTVSIGTIDINREITFHRDEV